MSLIRCKTKHLIDLLTDLAHTAAADPEISGATAGVLLHTARGYADPTEPGETDLLVGTSCTTVHIGHTWVEAYGQTGPMLWPINDVRAVLSVFKVLAKGEKDHTVDIRSEGGEITVAEDPNLFGETSLRFTAGPLEDWPRDRFRVLGNRFTGGGDGDPLPRTDYDPAVLAAFGKVARRRGDKIQTYRWHQTKPVQVQIGATYRGALMPSTLWHSDSASPRAAGDGPDAELYAPDLPDPDEAAE